MISLADCVHALQKILGLHLLPLLLLLLLGPVHIVLGGSVEDVEEALACVADLEHAGHVAAAVAVVGGAPDGAEAVVVQDLVALLAQLVGAQDMRHIVDLEELLDDLGAEGVAGAAGAEAELVALAVRVAPDEVGHGALVGDLAEAVDDLDLVDGVDAGRQAAVHAEDLVVDDDRQRQEVEHVGEVVPHVGVAVLARALGVEAVRLRHAARLVVAADQVHAVRVAQLEAYEERDGLNAEEAAVDVVAWIQSAQEVAAKRGTHQGRGSSCPGKNRQF